MRYYEPTPEQEASWRQWVNERPESVKRVAERFDPWSLYMLKSSGHRVTIVSFCEDGTMTANVSGDFNLVLFERDVFGINPDDLEPCDVPVSESLGSALSESEVHDNIDELRCLVRPDLWTMDEDGKAVRKN